MPVSNPEGCTRGDLVWILGKIPSLKGCSTGYPEQWWSPHPWRHLKVLWMWHLGPWVNGGLGRAGGVVALDSLRGLFQHQQFCFHIPYGISMPVPGLSCIFLPVPSLSQYPHQPHHCQPAQTIPIPSCPLPSSEGKLRLWKLKAQLSFGKWVESIRQSHSHPDEPPRHEWL